MTIQLQKDHINNRGDRFTINISYHKGFDTVRVSAVKLENGVSEDKWHLATCLFTPDEIINLARAIENERKISNPINSNSKLHKRVEVKRKSPYHLKPTTSDYKDIS